MFSFSSLFGGGKKDKTISNKHITVPAPENFISNPFDAHDILYLEKDINGLSCVLSIDNTPDLLNQPNAVTVKESTPKEILINRLSTIEDETINTADFGWSNFKIVEPVTETIFKTYLAAMGVFTVDEAVDGTRIVQRKIKRMVVFVKNDLWNIVLAPSQLHLYESEMKELEGILETLQVK